LVLITGDGKARRVAQAMQELQSSTQSDEDLAHRACSQTMANSVWMLDEGAGDRSRMAFEKFKAGDGSTQRFVLGALGPLSLLA
jgi:hypothetical protein